MIFSNSVYLFTYFFIYSVIGWLYEVIFFAVLERKVKNRSFLIGTYSFGFSITMILILMTWAQFGMGIAFFVISFLLCISGMFIILFMIKILFQVDLFAHHDDEGLTKLVSGIVLYVISMYFVELVFVFWGHPILEGVISLVAPDTLRFVSSFLIILLLADLLYSMKCYSDLHRSLKDLHSYLLHHHIDINSYSKMELVDFVNDVTDDDSELTVILGRNVFVKRILKAYPHIHFKGVPLSTNLLLEQIWDVAETRETIRKKPAKRTTVAQKLSDNYQGLTYYHLVLIFTIASIIGFIMETILCLMQRGYIESRAGVIYGPFTEIYGFGAVLMVLMLLPLAQKGIVWVFCGSAIIGGLFEALCSWLQEMIFSSVSWQYSYQKFSILGGRTSLYLMFWWGILGILFVKVIYPALMKVINRIPVRQSRFFASSLTLFFIFDFLISGIAVYRWSERLKDIPANNIIEEFLDQHYGDEVMEDVFPNMHFIDIDKEKE